MNKRVTFFVIILFFTLLTPLIANTNAEFTSGRVMHVQDGDTLWVDIEEQSIELADIKAIDLGAPGGLDAWNYLIGKTYDKIVFLDIDDRDRSGTSGIGIVAIVYVDHNSTHYLNVNKALLVENLARLRDEENDFNPNVWSLYVPKNSIKITTQINGTWSEVARFTGELTGGNGVLTYTSEVNGSIITDSFTCNHVEWRIRWKANLKHIHFYHGRYFLAILTFPEGTDDDSFYFINEDFSNIYQPSSSKWGTSYIHNKTGNFYMKISPNKSYVRNYTIIVEQNTDSPTPTPEPSPDGLTIGSNVIGPIIVIVTIIGSIAFFIKFRKK
jgi:endonuclease YncB( thermonuclease family)